MLEINVSADVKALQKQLLGLANRQIPFAASQALTAVARKVQAAETDRIGERLKNPSPFTRKSVGMRGARKSDLEALVFIKDRAAKYLDPFESGGRHVLPGRTLLNPKKVKLNMYGQLPRKMLAGLKARPDVFIGPVKTRNGVVNGVWQRPTDTKRVTLLNSKGRRLNNLYQTSGNKGLRLLIRFGDALPVNVRLDYHKLASEIIREGFDREMRVALASALASAR